MLNALRKSANSTAGKIVFVAIGLAILAGFALGDIQSLRSGSGFGDNSGTLASAGGNDLTERDLTEAEKTALTQMRQQNPAASYADLVPQFDSFVNDLINERVMTAFAADQKLIISKAMIDAEIANIPGVRGLDGRLSEASYNRWLQQQQLTDAGVRRIIMGDIARKLTIAPAGAVPQVPVGVASQYASLLLEQRDGQVAMVAVEPFKAGLNPSAGDLQAYYAQNRARYTVPEQRVLRIAPINPASLPVPAPTDAEIAAYYDANKATYGGTETRNLSQAVVADPKVAAAIAAKVRGGASFADAAKPAGLAAADVALGSKNRTDYEALVGKPASDQVFAAAKGSVVGPVKTALGWLVAKVEGSGGTPARPLAAVRGEIVTKITDAKRQQAMADIAGKIEDKLADGASLADTAKAFGLTLTDTPPITASGASRADPAYKFPADLQPVLKDGFDLAANDEPIVKDLGGGKGLALVGVGQIIAPAPAPLASILPQVKADWIQKKASDLARATAAQVAAKVAGGASVADAIKGAGSGVIARPISARRIQIAQMPPALQAPVKMLFSLGQGKSRMTAGPQGQAFFIVKLDKITPGNATLQPALVAQTRNEFQRPTGDEVSRQFLAAMAKQVGVKRNESAIAAAKARLSQSAE
ncbi:peptidyl-prolyl cis-trans isomerase [Sphingomonas sp. ASV193]|uniref:peptidylprolyl isomerase n=1 Tax=Sphingomonas sp. ASV193 TaxID=3144405 RepID=UPI0032E932BA